MEGVLKKPEVPKDTSSVFVASYMPINWQYIYTAILKGFFPLVFFSLEATKSTEHHYDDISANKAID